MAIMTLKQYNEFDFSDNQAVFEYVKAHLLKQGKSSSVYASENSRTCVYHDGIGNSCAIGCLIPIDLYDKNMEGHTIDHNKYLQLINTDLVDELQSIHDKFTPASWAKRLDVLENVILPKLK